ncbi:uncharacterized protein RCC_04847 [Ramularia collo-cygni]|uniref:Pathway-specific nitrogen regulator n=1 Tax=Ramularia collo-cygni TaxID=112498 RepID=A0A2D3UQA8_9PEZI|nr:uncharacterized protein RCC_04847 [Ramularia collo-cygni]CZT19002.1 uncharacterized protein RCC_04847 [Ramularia collo-cygni]
MARPSKAKSPTPKHAKFAVFEDAVDSSIPMPTPNSSRQPSSSNPKDDSEFDSELDVSEYSQERQQQLEDITEITEDVTPSSILDEQTDMEVDNDEEDIDRRESALTRGASISSLPESSMFDTDYDESMMPAMHHPYTPPSNRPTFRRPESVRRPQPMGSPTPYERSSPRRSALRVRSKIGTPRSVKQSPRSRVHRQQEGVEMEEKEYPLVLLHVTLLPIELRWSAESMLEVLPSSVIENLQLLRSKVSETILHRGILIPHPREEYELLEDRLLEALELREEKVTKCGHFRAISTSTDEGSVESTDSGVAFRLEDEDLNQCATCNGPIKSANAAIDRSGRKWSIKVFAANGLMRAPSWTAAWSEMERVDVEILPWISESLRKKLDALAEREEGDDRRRREEEEAHIREVVEEQVRIAHEERKRADEEERARYIQHNTASLESPPGAVQRTLANDSDLPKVFRTADIPLSMLLKNYLFLLAQDKRNVAMFVLALVAVWMSLRAAVSQGPMLDLSPLPSTCGQVLPQTMVSELNNYSAVTSNIEALGTSLDVPTEVEEAKASISKPQTKESEIDSAVLEEVRRPTEKDVLSSISTSAFPLDLKVMPVKSPRDDAPSRPDENTQQVCVNSDLVGEIFAPGICLPRLSNGGDMV